MDAGPVALHARRFGLVFCAVWCSTWVPAGAAQAQETVRRGDFEVGMDVGWTHFGSALVQPNGSRISVNGGYFLTRVLELEADITCLGGDEVAPAAGGSTFTLCTGSVGGVINLRAIHGVAPYVRLSVGQAQLDRGAEAGVFKIDERSAALQAGAGGRCYLGRKRRVSLRVDASWMRTGVFEKWATHFGLAVGVTLRLGNGR